MLFDSTLQTRGFCFIPFHKPVGCGMKWYNNLGFATMQIRVKFWFKILYLQTKALRASESSKFGSPKKILLALIVCVRLIQQGLTYTFLSTSPVGLPQMIYTIDLILYPVALTNFPKKNNGFSFWKSIYFLKLKWQTLSVQSN